MGFREIALEALALAVPPRCSICASPAPAESALCDRCSQLLECAPLGIARPTRRSAFDHSGVARDAIHALKFDSRPALARELSRLMHRRLPPEWLCDVAIVPAPAHPGRQRKRGYNQSLLLARGLAAISGASVLDCLVRAPGAPPQMTLPRAQRLLLARDAVRFRNGGYRQFGRRTSAEFPTNVLVCDDVATTGVTLEVCAEVLRESHPDLTLQIRAVTFASASAQKSQSAHKNTRHG